MLIEQPFRGSGFSPNLTDEPARSPLAGGLGSTPYVAPVALTPDDNKPRLAADQPAKAPEGDKENEGQGTV